MYHRAKGDKDPMGRSRAGTRLQSWSLGAKRLAFYTPIISYSLAVGWWLTPKAWHLLFPKGKEDSLRGRHLRLVTDSQPEKRI